MIVNIVLLLLSIVLNFSGGIWKRIESLAPLSSSTSEKATKTQEYVAFHRKAYFRVLPFCILTYFFSGIKISFLPFDLTVGLTAFFYLSLVSIAYFFVQSIKSKTPFYEYAQTKRPMIKHAMFDFPLLYTTVFLFVYSFYNFAYGLQ